MAPRLRVSAGPSVEKLSLVRVNDEEHPTPIESDAFQGKVAVRIENFHGLRPSSSAGDGAEAETAEGVETDYFKHAHAKGCTWSIQIQGRFKAGEISVDNVEYGNQFERPIRDRLPWGTSVALRAINILDPNLRHDIYCDEPWAFGPLITSMTRVNVKRLDDGQADDTSKWPSFPTGKTEADYVQDDTSALIAASDDAANVLPELEEQGLADRDTLRQLSDAQHGHSNRARFWGNQGARQAVNIRPNDVVTVSFDNGIIDFNTLRAVLPYTGGMGFELQKYWDGQPVRYFCKDRRTDKVFFVIELQIVEKDE